MISYQLQKLLKYFSLDSILNNLPKNQKDCCYHLIKNFTEISFNEFTFSLFPAIEIIESNICGRIARYCIAEYRVEIKKNNFILKTETFRKDNFKEEKLLLNFDSLFSEVLNYLYQLHQESFVGVIELSPKEKSIQPFYSFIEKDQSKLEIILKGKKEKLNKKDILKITIKQYLKGELEKEIIIFDKSKKNSWLKKFFKF